MSLSTTATGFARITAPRSHGAAVVEPPFHEASSLVAMNQARLNAWDLTLDGESVQSLSQAAREHLIATATQYTRQYTNVDFATGTSDGPIFLSGHQPQLFHAGVWFKDFALHRLAQAHDGLGIQLLVDNDLLRHRELVVPEGTPEQAGWGRIPFDTAAIPVPYEEATVQDPQLFARFGERVTQAIKPFVADPIIAEIWPDVVAATSRGRTIGAALAEARHKLERRWGLKTLEVPLSRLCQSRVFRLFTVRLLSEAEAFQSIYNETLHEYRQVHRVRSHSHPAPTLASDQGWCETPFWIWHQSELQREPLFTRHSGNALWLRCGWRRAEYKLGDSYQEMVQSLEALEKEGLKVRPRALMTTMYARLFLSDLFLHGIGGGKYDQFTDQLIHTFWNVEPPTFMIVSATLRLPCSRPLVEPDDIRQIDGLLRELWFHPELADPGSADREAFNRLASQKQRLLTEPPEGRHKSWHDQLEETNAQLRDLVKTKRDNLLTEKARLVKQGRADQHMASREYSFTLFPKSRIKKTLLDLLESIA